MKAVAVSTSAVQVVPGRQYRFVHIYNNGPNTVYLRYDGDDEEVTTALGMPLASGSYLSLNNDGLKEPFIHEIRAICAATESADLRIQGVMG